MFKSHYNKGMQMTFPNGLTISIQFGYGNYCSNRDMSRRLGDEMNNYETKSQTAEVAIWNEQNEHIRFKGKLCEGWLNTSEVAGLIYLTRDAVDLASLQSTLDNMEQAG